MRINEPVTQREFVLEVDATLMSTTDLQGNITYVNEAFVQVSGFSREELLGQPHNLVRHPDMPPEAFRDMLVETSKRYGVPVYVTENGMADDVEPDAGGVVDDAARVSYLNRYLGAVLEARAKLESAKALADAEVLRAQGAARANRILQDSLGGPNGYLRYLQIQALESSRASLIYVPTEAGLPITESGRIAAPANQ